MSHERVSSQDKNESPGRRSLKMALVLTLFATVAVVLVVAQDNRQNAMLSGASEKKVAINQTPNGRLSIAHGDQGNGYFSSCSWPTEQVLGWDWELVRRVSPRHNRWHPATDQLRGTAVYGKFQANDQIDATFSKRFNLGSVTEFLFMYGDCSAWVVASKAAVMGWYANAHRSICRSNIQAKGSSVARWYRRRPNREDPWISVIDHHPAIEYGYLVYGENNFGGKHAAWLKYRNGANVYIRTNAHFSYHGC